MRQQLCNQRCHKTPKRPRLCNKPWRLDCQPCPQGPPCAQSMTQSTPFFLKRPVEPFHQLSVQITELVQIKGTGHLLEVPGSCTTNCVDQACHLFATSGPDGDCMHSSCEPLPCLDDRARTSRDNSLKIKCVRLKPPRPLPDSSQAWTQDSPGGLQVTGF